MAESCREVKKSVNANIQIRSRGGGKILVIILMSTGINAILRGVTCSSNKRVMADKASVHNIAVQTGHLNRIEGS